jgi:RNA-directed DNA polymerase
MVKTEQTDRRELMTWPDVDWATVEAVVRRKSGLELKGYKPKPVRRVYIAKAGKPGRFRPLGIPTVKDRVMQAVVKLALEPEWETRFEANSYGFRPGRCAMDAVEAIYIALGQKGSSRWILDADISGFGEAADFHGDDRALAQGRINRPGYLVRQ